ncbi:MAG: hypothetical protein ABI162_12370 [Luteolibacter sp.]
MSIQPKDIKLLWGKAANRCSMKNCRRPLTAEEDEATPHILLGEMAHIVGEKKSKKSARGLSSLPLSERNIYTNLILLCANHHTIIDKDEVTWTVEKLHSMKRTHELWIEGKLGEQIDKNLQIYHDMIDIVTISLDLDRWRHHSDCLYRHIMHVDYPDGIYQLSFEYFKANLPNTIPEFEQQLKNLVHRSRTLLDYYMCDAVIIPGDPRIMNCKRYKDVPHQNFELKETLIEEYNLWCLTTHKLLYNLVKALNDFAECVRKHLRSDYFLREGKFCVYDEMGLTAPDFAQTITIPPHYFTDEQLDLGALSIYKTD